MHQKGSDPVWCDGLLERAAQLAALEEALAAVRVSRVGRLVLVAGEAGIGKTSLVRAFRAAHADVATSGAAATRSSPPGRWRRSSSSRRPPAGDSQRGSPAYGRRPTCWGC